MSRRKATATRKKAAKLPPAPKGLTLLLSLMSKGEPVDAIHARALKLVQDIQASDTLFDGVPISAEEYVRTVYRNTTTGSRDPETCIAAGLLIGAATAWFLMTDLQGGTR